jgi:T5SS/PEP-CTERM-associated repeat protein
MRTTNYLPEITPSFYRPFHRLVVMLTLSVGLLTGAVNSHATNYVYTNSTGATFDDPNAWNPVGGPGGSADDALLTNFTGSIVINLTNNFSGIGSFQYGAATGGPTPNSVTYSLNFGTNIFAGLSGGTTSASGFVFGQAGTTTVYICVGTLYCTNAAATPSNGRLIVGRNGPAIVYVTNGTVVAGNTVIANGSGASGSQLVISGPNSFWTNQSNLAVGNAASANLNSLVISNSGSLVALGTFECGFQSPSSFNMILLDTDGRLFTRTRDVLLGTGSGSMTNKATVQGGASWDVGGRSITIGNTGAGGNVLTVGNNGVVSNVLAVNIVSGNAIGLAGGLLGTSAGVTNSSGTIRGFGTITGSAVFTGTGTLSPGAGATVGTLTLSNNLTLVTGSTTILTLDSSQVGSNDQLNVAGTLTEAGTLTVITNGVAQLNIGDQYQLFVGTQSGSFSTINLPSLDPSKQWDTSRLASAGILAVTFEPVVPGMVGPTGQVVSVGSFVSISATVTGVPTPTVQWQYNGTNTTDGPTGNGSTLTGSTSSTLTLANAQTADSGNYCLIASNSAGVATNCMALTVSNGNVPPNISGLTDQTVIQGNTGTFSASVAGSPTPTLQWYQGATLIFGATGSSLILTNVQFSQDGLSYTIIASNSSGTATNSATLHVIITPAIQTQPQSLIVTNTQSASFTVVSTNGVPAPTYQWYFNNAQINNATNATYTIASAVPANAGSYHVIVGNTAGSIISTNATLTVDSTMAAVLTPASGAVGVCYDTPLFMAFNQTPVLSGAGKINIYNVTNPATPVDTIDTSLGLLQVRTIGSESFATYPVIINGNTAQIYPHLDLLTSNQQYFVTVDAGLFTDTNGALYAGITSTNGWVFTTKPTGPANPNNVVVAADGSGDFATVQGAVDSVASNNATYTLVNIRNGTYTEVVDTRYKNNITFRGQSRTGAVVGYANNNGINGSTHSRMAFKIYANDLAIENMTVVNTTPQGGSQAEAIMIETGAGQFILNNAEVDSRQDTILANVNSSQGYFYNSLIQGNFDYIWGGGNLFVTNCQFQTIPAASSYNLCAPRTDNGPTPGGWLGPDGRYASNGISFVNCLLTRSSSTVSNISMSDGNGEPDGVASWIYCHIDTTGGNGYVTPAAGVLSSQILWEYGNSNLNNSAAVALGLTVLTNGDPRLECASSATCWLYNWMPQLAPNILTNPVSVTVTAGVNASFNVSATGIPDPSYQWLFNGSNILGATSASLTISNALAANAGTYSVIVSNGAGSLTSSNATLAVVGTGPTASFTASPTSGTEPLGVTFTDTSSGSPNITLFWDFGDSSQATNAGGASFVHTYAAGTYTVTLTASNAFGANSTLVSNNLISVVTAFQAWQIQYFGSTTNPAAAPGADPFGKGISNTNQFLVGLNPTNPASVFQIISTVQNTTDVSIVWKAAGVRTNAVQATTGDGNGGYTTTNFTDISGPIILGVPGDAMTNYTDVGGATNVPARYYRIRLVP